ncbi:hypothetical protein [Streptomyces calidiresistens]|uniref:Uncharacterized protein n=1 Tax=Streptomyces calidiresistens TaxID=1485586 RepID=A0A7W3T3C3_9ACTN|nr:hypothetical protein [Streptomyces calidiresistens]MBB0230163.1 hypothetical protein [Streptomyces calidiresistens]
MFGTGGGFLILVGGRGLYGDRAAATLVGGTGGGGSPWLHGALHIERCLVGAAEHPDDRRVARSSLWAEQAMLRGRAAYSDRTGTSDAAMIRVWAGLFSQGENGPRGPGCSCSYTSSGTLMRSSCRAAPES